VPYYGAKPYGCYPATDVSLIQVFLLFFPFFLCRPQDK
jgi:hypothetical protein